ncbi:MAG: hypothetical protein KGP35_09900 [Bacteroidetes bacterium]|nr:hypothetical protein [Bacteroidota bacterium]
MLSISETSHLSKRSKPGDPSLSLRMTLPKCVALARILLKNEKDPKKKA